MASIARALARIKDDVRTIVSDESIHQACRAAGHRWRERQLGPVETVHLFVLQAQKRGGAETGTQLVFQLSMGVLRSASR